IVFCNRKMDVDVLAKSLKAHGFNAAPIHGDLDQSVRTKTLDDFRDGRLRLLIASDVAARGLDIPAVSHVFNFDVPSHSEDYVHRIGRTGRAGRSGVSITIATPSDEKYLAGIEALIKQPIPRVEAPTVTFDDSPDRGQHRQPRSRHQSRPEREDRPRREDRAREDRARDEAPLDDRPVAAPRAAPEPVAETPFPPRRDDRREPRREDRPRDDRRREPRRDDHRQDNPVVGMGDHVPDFILRSFAAVGAGE
ncbi:MAG: helicase-related protein, partial [Gemmobacter sp.]